VARALPVTQLCAACRQSRPTALERQRSAALYDNCREVSVQALAFHLLPAAPRAAGLRDTHRWLLQKDRIRGEMFATRRFRPVSGTSQCTSPGPASPTCTPRIAHALVRPTSMLPASSLFPRKRKTSRFRGVSFCSRTKRFKAVWSLQRPSTDPTPGAHRGQDPSARGTLRMEPAETNMCANRARPLSISKFLAKNLPRQSSPTNQLQSRLF
jgi:hypothetical protein